MLFRYFFTRFIVRFSLFFVGLVPLFASCDMLVRLASVPFSFHILKLLWYMIPLVAMFAVPIASLLAVGMTVGDLFTHDELLMLHYFSSARRVLLGAVGVFSLTLLLFYMPILFYVAPQGYWKGKRFLIRSAQVQIEHLPPRKFHKVASRGTIFFKEKQQDGLDTHFKDILLMVQKKKNKQYLVTAEKGDMEDGMLHLFHGTIYSHGMESQCVATFKILEIAFEKIFFDAEKRIDRPTKFLTFGELLEGCREQLPRWRELHKRVGQAVWQLLFPFLILWLMMSMGRPNSNVLRAIVLSGALFLFSYLSLNITSLFITYSIVSVCFFYTIPWGVLLLTILISQGRRSRG